MDPMNGFETHLQESGKGGRTIEEYRHAVMSFEHWFQGQTDNEMNLDDVTALDLHDWVAYMRTVERLAPATINKRIAALKVYWAYLVDTGISTLDPTRKLRMKRISNLEQSPRWLTRREQDRLIHTVSKEKNTWKRSRNLALVQTMLQAGLRISEVASLDLQDLDFKRKTLTVRAGKGGKHRVALMNFDLVKALESWVEIRGEAEALALFISERSHGRMTRQGLHYLVRKYMDVCGLEGDSAHALRHSFCRNLIDANQPLQVVAQLAGHESMETTRRYITPSEQDLRRAVESISSER